jgi:type I restriction enzyme S subunit
MNQLGKPHGAIGASPHLGIISPAYFVAGVAPTAEPTFLHYLLRTRLYISEYERRGKFMPPSQFDISWDQFRLIEVTLPPLDEQRAIADFLDTETARIDALITKKRRLIELLDERYHDVVRHGVSGVLTGVERRVPSSVPWMADRPDSWDEAMLKLVADLGTGHTPSREHPEWWVDCTIPWVTTGEVSQMRSDRLETLTTTRERISALGLANSSAVLHPAHTVVLCRTAASAGYSAIMGVDMATSQDIVTWTCGLLLRPRFLLLCLRAMRGDLLGRLAMGSTHKTIYMPDVESIRVPLPPVEEQDRIVEAVWSRLRVVGGTVDRLHRQIELLVEHRQALITAAVTGELEIPRVAA